jgi:sugar lactone lactonase YvrE
MMKTVLIPLLLLAACASSQKDRAPIDPATHDAMATADLKQVTEFKGAQVTGVTVAQDGRVFANFPRWRDGIPFSVVEVSKDGSYKAYPNESWNSWNGKGIPPKDQFSCVQSVVAHNGLLYVVDPSSPFMKGVIGQPRVFVFDLATNTLRRTYTFTPTSAPKQSYLNDIRIDDMNNVAYMTDSGIGAIVVLDLKSGHSRRLLENDKSTKAEDLTLTVEGKEFTIGGKPQRVNSDGIALSPDGKYLYYHALTGKTLYRISTQSLNDKKRSSRKLAKAVENLGPTPAPDGMIFDKAGNLYMADLHANSVVYRTPAGDVKTLVQDPRIKWADTFAINGDQLVFTASRLHETPAGTPAADSYKIYQTPLVR